jgi:hypothetical protein
MLITDIGQGNVEEVNLGAPGANYGWEVREGTFVTDPADDGRLYGLPEGGDEELGFTTRGAVRPRRRRQTVAGSFVYRGQGSRLYGHYAFGDIPTGRVFHVRPTS